jgi:hypothetical protein
MKYVQSQEINKYKRHVEYLPSKCPSSFHNHLLCWLLSWCVWLLSWYVWFLSWYVWLLSWYGSKFLPDFCFIWKITLRITPTTSDVIHVQCTFPVYSLLSSCLLSHSSPQIVWVSSTWMNACMHEYLQSWTVMPSQWSWDSCEWLGEHKNVLVKCLFV